MTKAKADEAAAVEIKDYAAAQKANDAVAAAEATLKELLATAESTAAAGSGQQVTGASADAPADHDKKAAGRDGGKNDGSGGGGGGKKGGGGGGSSGWAAVPARGGHPTRAGSGGDSPTGTIMGIATAELYYCGGCLCSNSMIYTEMPNCIGAHTTTQCPCYESEFCLKQNHEPFAIGLTTRGEGKVCELSLPCQRCSLKAPDDLSTLYHSSGQCLCQVSECTLPPGPDHVMTCGTCGVSVLPRVTVLSTFGEVSRPEATPEAGNMIRA